MKLPLQHSSRKCAPRTPRKNEENNNKMDKKEIFNKIAEITADVCNVTVDDIMGRVKKEDVSIARSLLIFWANESGFSVESLVICTGSNYANSINSVKARIEEYWRDKWAYHILAKEIGTRLLDYAHSIGEDFDLEKPLKRMRNITGR